MSHTLSFRVAYKYGSGLGIALPVILSAGASRVKLLAKVDTGADVCVFQREHGEALGFRIEDGDPQQIATAAGSFLAYAHEVSMLALGFELDATVYFAFHKGLPRNVLGRRGWLEQLRVGIVDYERRLYASRYDEPV